jgi:diguanylate cyclase (GGDEF)-like protein
VEEERTLEPRSVVKLSLVAFSLLLVGLIAYGVWWMRESNASLDELSRSTALSNAYEDALQSITNAEAITQRFVDGPTPELRAEFDRAVAETAVAIAYIQENGSADDRVLIQSLIDTFAPQVPRVNATLDAVLAGEGVVEALPPDQLINDLKRKLEAPEARSQAAAAEALRNYESAQRTQTAIVVSALILGLPVMAGLIILIRVFERRETVAQLTLERLEEAALTDSLTGLGNHRAYQEELQDQVALALASGRTLSLALIDVDEFKEVNDTAGHARGDQILFQLGRLLREACEPGDRRFRIGGDEFAVIMPRAEQGHAQQMMERFRSLASLTGATVSIGIAQLEAGDDTEILREKADSTLYTAKRRGRNAVYTFDNGDAEQKVVTQAKIKTVRDLVREDVIEVAYQPVLRSDRHGIIGYEALARIPEGYDLAGPQEAFDIAERIGRAHELDLLCMREGLLGATDLADGQLLFLNLSPRTLDHAGFSAGSLVEMVIAAGLTPERVCFEITERSTAPIEVVQREVGALRAAGFRIALDDVGAGNAGLEMMRRLQVDFVKIDRSVLLGAMEKGPGRGVLLAIVVFASEAGAFVIAEGIETEEMLAVIQDMNASGPFSVQGIQGYVLGAPMGVFPPSSELPLSA